jgi:hypothetical protein
VLSLYRWIPWVSRRLPFGRDNIGDPFVTPVSPQVRVTFRADRDLEMAATGVLVEDRGGTKVFEARDVRDFALNASPSYAVRTRSSIDGQTRIRVLHRHGDGKLLMRWARRSLARFERWVGEYPYPELDVAESSGAYAMEAPGLVWLPLTVLPAGNVPYILSHEVAHQWFYGVVGNDQTTDPFVDEALADFLARRLHHRMRASYCAADRLDLSIYDYHGACYFEVVYIQGGAFVDWLRRRMGGTAFWGAMRAYYAANAYRLSSNRVFLEHMRAAAGDGVLPRYRARFPSLYPG